MVDIFDGGRLLVDGCRREGGRWGKTSFYTPYAPAHSQKVRESVFTNKKKDPMHSSLQVSLLHEMVE